MDPCMRDLDVSCLCSAAWLPALLVVRASFHFNLSLVVPSQPDRLQGLCKGCLYVPQCVLFQCT